MAKVVQTYVGTVKTFNILKGWGHIECDQTQELYGKDVFLLRSQLNGVVPVKGDQVFFDVTDGQKGIEATNVQINSLAQTSGAGVYVGAIKSWNPEKGWGHITCEQTQYLYEKDIFVMRSAVPGGHCIPGDKVSFSIQDGTKGPEATGVIILSSKHTPVPNTHWHNQGSFVGTVKNFDEEKGWGHIICDATRQLYAKDMFVMRSSLNGQTLRAGEQVRFSVAMGIKGPEAREIIKGAGARAVPPAMSGLLVPPQQTAFGNYGYIPQQNWAAPQASMVPQMHMGQKGAAGSRQHSGVVKNWNPEKGWGFISCEETMTMYGKDIFLHKKELFGQSPLAGSPVQFSVSWGADGRPIAANVSMNGGYQPVTKPAAYKGYMPY